VEARHRAEPVFLTGRGGRTLGERLVTNLVTNAPTRTASASD